MKYAVALLMILVSGCHSSPKPSQIDMAVEAGIDTQTAIYAWEHTYASKANLYTERTYQCMSEMYSLAYQPVDSGPVCRESCKILAEANSFVDAAPNYIVDPRQYYIGWNNICPNPTKKHKRRQP